MTFGFMIEHMYKPLPIAEMPEMVYNIIINKYCYGVIMELWDVYDINMQKTGQTVGRGQQMADDEYHLVAHICIFNSHGQLLIQHRQPFKKGFSNLWDISAAGSALAGETSRQAAEREVREEIGIDLSINTRPSFNISFDRGFDDFYLVDWDGDISELNLQYEEVESVKWATREEILSMIAAGTFVPYYPSLINMIFDMKNSPVRYGAHFRE